MRADKQVYAMYREYRVLKAELEKENAAQTRGGAKPSAPDPRMQTSAPSGTSGRTRRGHPRVVPPPTAATMRTTRRWWKQRP